MQDPNPDVAGRGLKRLSDAGIDVRCGVLENEARALNPGFLKRMEHGLPFVRVKMAMSLDGRTAMANGESQWITGPAARSAVQRLRAQASVVLTGADTVLADGARLTVRAAELGLDAQTTALAMSRPPLRVLIDGRLRVPSLEVLSYTEAKHRFERNYLVQLLKLTDSNTGRKMPPPLSIR